MDFAKYVYNKIHKRHELMNVPKPIIKETLLLAMEEVFEALTTAKILPEDFDLDSFEECEACDEFFHVGKSGWMDDDGVPLCEACYTKAARKEE